MPAEPTVSRDPKWVIIGGEIRAARMRLGLSQSEMARTVDALNQTHISRDEAGNGMPYARLKVYCDFLRWDYNQIVAYLNAPISAEPVITKARREYFELLQLLDTKLENADEQDLVDEALQLVIMHRYPELKPADFTSPDGR